MDDRDDISRLSRLKKRANRLPLLPGVLLAATRERDGTRETNDAERTLMGLAMTDIWAVTFVFLSAVA